MTHKPEGQIENGKHHLKKETQKKVIDKVRQSESMDPEVWDSSAGFSVLAV